MSFLRSERGRGASIVPDIVEPYIDALTARVEELDNALMAKDDDYWRPKLRLLQDDRAEAEQRAEQAEAALAAERAKRCVSCRWYKAFLGNYECSGVTELRECPDPDDFCCNRYATRPAPEAEE
jgi:hypothetical protein